MIYFQNIFLLFFMNTQNRNPVHINFNTLYPCRYLFPPLNSIFLSFCFSHYLRHGSTSLISDVYFDLMIVLATKSFYKYLLPFFYGLPENYRGEEEYENHLVVKELLVSMVYEFLLAILSFPTDIAALLHDVWSSKLGNMHFHFPFRMITFYIYYGYICYFCSVCNVVNACLIDMYVYATYSLLLT